MTLKNIVVSTIATLYIIACATTGQQKKVEPVIPEPDQSEQVYQREQASPPPKEKPATPYDSCDEGAIFNHDTGEVCPPDSGRKPYEDPLEEATQRLLDLSDALDQTHDYLDDQQTQVNRAMKELGCSAQYELDKVPCAETFEGTVRASTLHYVQETERCAENPAALDTCINNASESYQAQLMAASATLDSCLDSAKTTYEGCLE